MGRAPGAGRRAARLAVRAAASCAVALALGVAAANVVVLRGAGSPTEHVDAAPQADAALVLGARVLPDGSLSAMLDDRVATGVALYRAGKVRKLLLSGDHGTPGYDEVGAMRRSALAAGVPEADIFCDHAGFDTWDSVVRARQVFQARSVLVVTQRFHLARAVWLARAAGLAADGVVADRRPYGPAGRRSEAREVVARAKGLVEAGAGRRPRFLGPALPLTGDGRSTDG